MVSQHAQWTLNKIENTFNGVQNIFCLKSYIKGHRNGQLDSLAEPARFRPNGLGCLAGRFYGLQSMISDKIYSEPLMHALSSCEYPVEVFFTLIQSPVSAL